MKQNIIGFSYLGGLISQQEIDEIKKTLSDVDIEVREFDKEGEFVASIDELTNVISIILHYSLISSFIYSVAPNAAWDAIKVITIQTWKKARGKKYKKVQSGRIDEKNITFGVEVKLDNNNFNFKFEGIQSEEEANIALDKILTFLREQHKSTVEDGRKAFIGTYNSNQKEWNVEDFIEILKKSGKLK